MPGDGATIPNVPAHRSPNETDRKRQNPGEGGNLIDGVRKGDPLCISRAISAAENGTAEGRALLDAIAPLVGRAVRIGFTGPPGVGKSTTIDSLVQVVRSKGERVGVIAVDPTSPF